ncbi:hypothetical protein [Epilithonimonas xixisoli]|uniref:Uncharacterized protein n=1 Tax=Epilithonimonas xixisoli TaxID=1476462 RepID=A0A4R8IAE8_9FLAO|nr:hypothetical protein [Epilithonimonas xixisoli]TDX87088.1 hypothetical protein B0I22_1267 [Epilithonimonas xixisoli]
MIQTGDSVYTTLHYAGGQSTGKMTYFADEFSFVPNATDNLTKGLAAKSQRQNCSFKYDEVSFLKKGGFLFFKVIAIKILLADGTEEQLSLYSRKTNDVFEFLKSKVPSSSIK